MKPPKNPISPSISDHHQSAILVHCSHAQLVDVTELVANPRNPNKHSDKQVALLAKIIRHQGWRSPITVSNRSGFVVTGHGRLQAAILLGEQLVPVDRQDFATEADEWAHLVADNRIAELADADKSMIADLLKDLDAEGLDMDLTGFDMQALEELLAETNAPDTTEDEVPDVPAEPITKPGDLWILGEHRVMCGDSTKAEDVERLMAGAKADLCFTSPPYGAANVAKIRDHYVPGATKRKSFYDQHEDDPGSWPDLMAGWFDAFRPVSECVICNVQMLADNKRAMVRWLAERADDLVDVIVWDKINAAPQMQANVLSNAFEFCFVFGGNASRTIPFADFHGTLSNVLRLDPRGKNDQADKHRAVFPLELPAWFMQSLCREAKTIVDPFCGTGTTLIAAEQLGRKCYGMEISPSYCDVIVKRWENLTNKTAVLCND